MLEEERSGLNPVLSKGEQDTSSSRVLSKCFLLPPPTFSMKSSLSSAAGPGRGLGVDVSTVFRLEMNEVFHQERPAFCPMWLTVPGFPPCGSLLLSLWAAAPGWHPSIGFPRCTFKTAFPRIGTVLVHVSCASYKS